MQLMKFEFILSNTKKQKEMLNANDRINHYKANRITQYLRRLAKIEGKKKSGEPYSASRPCRVIATFYPPTRRRIDPPNFNPTIKAILDGFTDAGIWPDDNYSVIPEHVFRYGGLSGIEKRYRVVIEIEEIDNGKT